jgi:predicted nucleic acid binding AN1-type Zn finger protein
LQKKPQQRYENAASFHRAIQALQSEIRSSRPAPVAEPHKRSESSPKIVMLPTQTCPICTGTISGSANSCPYCGNRLTAAHGNPDSWAFYGALGGAALLAATVILALIAR